ncbi:P8 [Calibrachoa mottle virus]|uniref:p8 n=1 Tax=Calibrachoa mottle virus TaxID=204928 RepID=C7E3L3_9TOMB|nr:P8 [Calibrachoa mottle virus]ACT36596.1 P8 [Calibrachoa mottle virus]
MEREHPTINKAISTKEKSKQLNSSKDKNKLSGKLTAAKAVANEQARGSVYGGSFTNVAREIKMEIHFHF